MKDSMIALLICKDQKRISPYPKDIFCRWKFVDFPFYGQKNIYFLKNTRGMELLTGPIPITIHLGNAMIGPW